jgi:hypothetical protein
VSLSGKCGWRATGRDDIVWKNDRFSGCKHKSRHGRSIVSVNLPEVKKWTGPLVGSRARSASDAKRACKSDVVDPVPALRVSVRPLYTK